MWRQYIILAMTVVSCAAVPKTGGKRELQRLVRLPRIEFSSPLSFDRTTGFVVFPNESDAAAEAAELLKEVEGTPKDGQLYLNAGQVLRQGGDGANSIRSFARAVDLFARKVEVEPGNREALIGWADALIGLGRFGEAQSALDRAALIDSENPDLLRARARYHKEKAWSAFVGEENRFAENNFLQTLDRAVRRANSARIQAATAELASASRLFEKLERPTDRRRNDGDLLREQAAFKSFRAALGTAFTQAQNREPSYRELKKSLFGSDAVADLVRAAELPNADPAPISAAIFAYAIAAVDGDETADIWTQLGAGQQKEVLSLCQRLRAIWESGGREATAAAEFLGCAQIYLMKDYLGGERSFRRVIENDPLRERSWDLLLFSIFSAGDTGRLVEASEERSAVLKTPRSSAMLIKSYDFQGDTTRAEWTALSAAGTYPHDLHVNLSLAAVLLKREEFNAALWRAGDALNKAEKQLGASASRQNRLDFVLLKSIYLGLSDQVEEAKNLLRPYAIPGRTPAEVQEILRALEY